MDVSTPWRFCLALVVLLVVAMPAQAGADGAACELRIQGHSIFQLTLVEKRRHSGVRFVRPNGTVQLPAGEYRVEQVKLEDGYVLDSQPGQRQDWFEVTPAGPNELVVGAPLYPTAAARRHGGFVQLDYKTVDAAGRSYRKTADSTDATSPPPTFTVQRGGEEIGSGSFEYG
jgi:hypothetical protein